MIWIILYILVAIITFAVVYITWPMGHDWRLLSNKEVYNTDAIIYFLVVAILWPAGIPGYIMCKAITSL